MIKTYTLAEHVSDVINLIEYQAREKKKFPCEFDCFSDGCLLDNYIMYGKRCLYFFREMYVNSGKSGYYVVTCDYRYTDECNRIIEYACSLMDIEEE